MDKKHKGALNEITAIKWLMEQGCEVFRNVSPHGSIDLVSISKHTKVVKLIDVKAASRSGHRIRMTKEQDEMGVVFLYVQANGECSFEENPLPATAPTNNCEVCGDEFRQNRGPKRFCSKRCRNKHYYPRYYKRKTTKPKPIPNQY